MQVIRDVMLSADECDTWLTLREIAALTHYGEASISAQLRHLRKTRFGGHRVEKRQRVSPGPGEKRRAQVWEYRLRRSLGRAA